MREISIFFILILLLSCNENRKTNNLLNKVDTVLDGHNLNLDSSTQDSLNHGLYKYSDNDDSCLSILEWYSNYWRNDSLGKNGFRELYGQFILKDCNCKGRKWNIVRKYLGSPNQSGIMEDKHIYRYRLNYFSTSWDIGTGILEIVVDSQGIIRQFIVYEVDG